MKRTKGQLSKTLWKVFSEYIRKRDKGICFTCGRQCEGKGYHAGHFVTQGSGGLLLKFHEKNVHGQCYNCNINLGGNHYIYGKKLGAKIVKELYDLKDKEKTLEQMNYIKNFPYEEKIEFYKEKIKSL